MEHVQSPVKGCFMKETSLKLNQELVQDDLPNAAGFNAITPGEFSVDDLFDFSKMSGCDDEETTLHDVVLAEQTQIPTKTTEMVTDLNGVVVKKETSEICVPADDVADLEWLSHFVEDSFTEYSLTCALPVKNSIAEETLPVEDSGKPTRATRSKRVRNGGFSGWSFSGSETASSSSSSSSTTSLSSASTLLIYTNSINHNDAVFDSLSNSPPDTAATMKKSKVCKPSTGSKLAQPRRCSHCGVQKTPQWRAGPLGAKTLCNACGVRFKSGRLLPEYRPACSPTFSSELHSNSHRKVLEMRNKKGAELPDSGRVPAVSSF